MYNKKFYIYILLYSLFLNPLFAFSIEAGADKTITIGEVATLEATVSADVNSADLIWKVGEQIYAGGEIFYFYPTETGTYVIDLYYQGNKVDSLTVTVVNNANIETLISKFSINNKCMKVKIVSGKGHSPSYIYLKVEDQAEQLLYTASIGFHNRFPIINSPEVIALQDGGYSVFWLEYSQMSDEFLSMSRFDSNGTMVVNNKRLNSFNPGGSNVTIKQLSNQNYIVGNCTNHGSLRIRIYDYNTENRLHQFYPNLGTSCWLHRHYKTKIMPILNNTFVFSFDNKLWHFDNNGNEIPFN